MTNRGLGASRGADGRPARPMSLGAVMASHSVSGIRRVQQRYRQARAGLVGTGVLAPHLSWVHWPPNG